MVGSIRKFTRDVKGAFAMQFALMAVPLCVCTGLAIDGGRAFLAHFELASALDAAALAVGSTTRDGADLDGVARSFVDANFKTQHDTPVALELLTDDEKAILKGTVQINTFFMPLVGQPYVTISAESEVRRGGNNVEVALALDVTGSMNETRMDGLTAASKTLIDEVVSSVQEPYFSKVAVVPWSQSVYVDDVHVDAGVEIELRGTLIGAKTISGATWRKASTSTKSISSAGWRTNSGRPISNVAWKNGSSYSISSISKTNSNSRIRVRTSSNAGYSNGDTVVITGANGSYSSLNGNKYKVADRTTSSPYYFWLQNVGTSTYTTPPSGSTNASSGASQRCLNTDCELRVTASSHGFATGDLIYINGVSDSGGGSTVNNTWGNTWTISYVDSSNFYLDGTNGPSFQTYSSSGTASECYVSDCRYRVETTANHSLSASDDVFIWGASESGGGTSINTSTNASINVSSPSGTVFYLPGNGNSYKEWTSGGSLAACANAYCNVVVTSTAHGLSNGDRVQIEGVGGITGINTCPLSNSGTCSSGSRLTWPIAYLSANSYRLTDTTPALSNMSSNYSSGGGGQCLTYGCERFRFNNTSGNERVYRASPCLVERYGADAATDTAPGTSPLGVLYTDDADCTRTNYLTPLTSNKNRLYDSIDDLTTGGSTAGQIGIAWAWYMLSPEFAGVWDKEAENAGKAYDTKELVKVAVLMTDGEFNYATCSGLNSSSWGGGSNSICNPGSSPFTQAETICEAMKLRGVVIYTVGLELNTALYSDDFLENCATSSQHAFLAANVDELKEAFKKIASSISKLRLAR